MKKYILVALLLLSPLLGQLSIIHTFRSCRQAKNCQLSITNAYAAKPDKQIVVLSVDIHCQGCIDKIMKNIAFEKGVKDIVCDLKTKTVTVTYDASKTDVPTLLKAFEKIKKPATVVKTASV